MKTKFYPIEKLRKDIIDIISEHLDISNYSVFFFGSRVSGRGSERSDIDVGIEGTEPVPLEIMAKIRERIDDLPTLYSIDIVDFQNTDEDFRKVAKEHIEVISPMSVHDKT